MEKTFGITITTEAIVWVFLVLCLMYAVVIKATDSKKANKQAQPKNNQTSTQSVKAEVNETEKTIDKSNDTSVEKTGE